MGTMSCPFWAGGGWSSPPLGLAGVGTGMSHLHFAPSSSPHFHPRPGNWVWPRFPGAPDEGQMGQAVQMGTWRGKHPPTPSAPSAAGALGPEPHSSPPDLIFLPYKSNFKAKPRAWRPAAPGAGRGPCTVSTQSLVTPVAHSASGCWSCGAGAGSGSIPCPGRDARSRQRFTGDQLNTAWVTWGHTISPMDASEGRPRRNPSEPPQHALARPPPATQTPKY